MPAEDTDLTGQAGQYRNVQRAGRITQNLAAYLDDDPFAVLPPLHDILQPQNFRSLLENDIDRNAGRRKAIEVGL